MYKVGDKVVYPHHGAGTVVKKEKRTVLGEEREYLQIQILHNDMTVQVPTENADRVGLRKVIDETTVEQVLKALRGSGTTMPKNWNRRFKHNRDKMKTGDIFELAEVVRNLSLRDHDPLDPLGGVEPLERLRDERPVVQRSERLRAVQPEAFTTSSCSENRPHTHGRRE